MQNIYSEMEVAGYSPRTRRFVHTVLREAIEQAVEWGLVGRNVVDKAIPPKEVRQEMKTFDATQAASFLKAAMANRLYALYVVAITTGMRQGELIALQWSDVDLESATIQVRRTITYGKKLKEPKTKKGNRRIDLPAIAVNALKDHRKHTVADRLAGSPLVFSNTKGGLLSRHNLTRSYKAILRKAGIPKIRFHDLRHTMITLMLAEGENPRLISELAGHATVGFTLDRYAHVLPGMGKQAAAKMQRLLATQAS